MLRGSWSRALSLIRGHIQPNEIRTSKRVSGPIKNQFEPNQRSSNYRLDVGDVVVAGLGFRPHPHRRHPVRLPVVACTTPRRNPNVE